MTTDRTAPRPRLSNLFNDREGWLVAPVYFFLAFINLRARLMLAPSFLDGTLTRNHETLLQFAFTNNEQSRLLQFYIPEAIHTVLRLPIEDAYIVQWWLFTFLTFLCFHIYLRKWFSCSGCIAGVALLAATMPLTYFNHLQESAPLMSLIFLLGLWALREKRDGLFALTLLIGSLNNETTLILTAAYVFLRFRSWKLGDLRSLVQRGVLVNTPAWAAVIAIRIFTWDNPHLGPRFVLGFNLRRIAENTLINPLHLYEARYLHIFMIFNALWIYAFLRWREKDVFFRRVSLMIPFFIAGHFITGLIYEVRQMLPLAFIIIPMAFQYLFETRDPASRHQA